VKSFSLAKKRLAKSVANKIARGMVKMTNKKEPEHLHNAECEDNECGCGEYDRNTIILEAEDGSTAEYRVIEVLPYNGNNYIALLDQDEETLYILRIDDIENAKLSHIEDDEEYAAVVALFEEYIENPETFWEEFDEELEDEEEETEA